MTSKSNRNSMGNKLTLKRLVFEGSFELPSPPSDVEEKTTVELELLESVSLNLKPEDKKSIEKYSDALTVYCEFVDYFSLLVSKEELKELVEDIRLIVFEEKNKHNRKHPSIVGKNQKFDISEEYMIIEDYSTYPSSGACESMFLSLYLSEKYPIYKDMFMEATRKVSNSRLLSSKNYPTDILAGHTLAHLLYNEYKESCE